jgi:hypothetical protein
MKGKKRKKKKPSYTPVPFSRFHSDKVKFNKKEQRKLGKSDDDSILGEAPTDA